MMLMIETGAAVPLPFKNEAQHKCRPYFHFAMPVKNGQKLQDWEDSLQ